MEKRSNSVENKNRKVKRRWLLIAAGLLTVSPFIFPGNVKTVFIPDKIKVEENGAIEEIVHNMTEEEIYGAYPMYMVGEFIYLAGTKPVEVIKLSLEGKTLGRFGSEGQGPGEFIWIGGINGFKGKIIILETKLQKLVIYNDKLEFIREFKLKKRFFNLLIDKKKRYILYGRPSADYYFSVHTENFKYLSEFGMSMTPITESRKKFSFDFVKYTIYVPGEDSIWASFRNRYDLRYYKKEKLTAEIKARKSFFKSEEQDMAGRKYIYYKDEPLNLAKHKDRLFYIYRIDNSTYCDIFDLSGYQLLRRLKFSFKYNRIVHYKENIFYAFRFHQNEENDVLLVRLKIIN